MARTLSPDRRGARSLARDGARAPRNFAAFRWTPGQFSAARRRSETAAKRQRCSYCYTWFTYSNTMRECPKAIFTRRCLRRLANAFGVFFCKGLSSKVREREARSPARDGARAPQKFAAFRWTLGQLSAARRRSEIAATREH